MKFFLMEAEDRNPIPWAINKNQAIDIRDINAERFHKLPKHGLVEMEVGNLIFYPPTFSKPFFMISEDCIEVINMYDNRIRYCSVFLFCENSTENANYFIPLLPETECLADEHDYQKPVLKEIVVRNEVVRDYPLQRIKGFSKSYVLVRMDLAESMLQRGALGIRLTEVAVV